MSAACASARTAVYRRRRPERTVLYRTVQTHLATWLELSRDSRLWLAATGMPRSMWANVGVQREAEGRSAGLTGSTTREETCKDE